MSPLRKLIAEIHRRSLWQVLGIYVFGSWIGYEVILGLTDGVGLPPWVPAFAIVLFIIGLPVVLATAFIQEGMPLQATAPAPVSRDVTPSPLPESRPSRTAGVLTWKRALTAGAAAFVLLGASAGGYMGLRAAGIGPFANLVTSGALEERAPVLLTSFSSPDTLLADAITEALRVDLEQSSSVAVVPLTRLEEALARMERPAATRVGPQLGAELAEREGIPALLTGEVTPAGTGWLITARMIEVASGSTLASFRESVKGEGDVIDAVDRVSRSVREDMGESYATLRRSEPLERVTTANLRALRVYSQSVVLPTEEAIPLLEEAVRLDTAFAMAWRRLSGRYTGQGDYQRAAEAALRAYQHRDRLTERERLMTLGSYHYARFDFEASINAYRALVEKWPDYTWAVGNLALAYRRQYDYANAAKHYEIALEQDTAAVGHHLSLVYMYWRLNDTTRARQHLEDYKRVRPDALPTHLFYETLWAAASAEFDSATAIARQRLDTPSTPGQTSTTLARLMYLAGIEGRVSDVADLANEHFRLNERRDRMDLALANLALEAVFRLEHGLPAAEQRARFERLMARTWDSLPPLNRPYGPVAWFYATLEDSVRVERLNEEFASIPQDLLEQDDTGPTAVMAYIHLERGRPERALELMRQARATCRGTCFSDLVGDAFYAMSQPDSAIAYYTQYLDERFLDRMVGFMRTRARVIERLAQMHDARGESAEAARYYAMLVDQWKHADPVFQPRVQAAQARLTQLTGEGR